MTTDSYRWIEHTAELELELHGHDEPAVFAQALRAFAELVGDEAPGEPVSCQIAIAGEERALLLARWLDELEFLAETEALVPERAEGIDVGPRGVRAVIHGHRGTPRGVVKGATYHRLSFGPAADGYRATVILDV